MAARSRIEPLTAEQLWLASLEKERTDNSWRKNRSAEAWQELDSRAQRDADYFNAGRYAQGARDKTAASAWQAIGELPLD